MPKNNTDRVCSSCEQVLPAMAFDFRMQLCRTCRTKPRIDYRHEREDQKRQQETKQTETCLELTALFNKIVRG